MSKNYVPGVVLIGLMAMFALGKGRLATLGHATGGEGDGCSWESPVEVGSQPLASGSSSAQAPAAAEKVQSSMARYGTLKAIAALPEAHRGLAAVAVAELSARASTAELDPEQVRFSLHTSRDAAPRMNVRQQVDGVPVFGVSARVSFDEATRQASVNGELLAGLKVDTSPQISEDQAVAKALTSVGCAECKPEATRGMLFVLRHEGTDHLVYRVWPRLGLGQEKHPMVFVDAHSGEIVRNCPAEEPACFDRD